MPSAKRPSVRCSSAIQGIGHRNSACRRTLVERFEQSNAEGKGKALGQTRFHFVQIDVDLQCFGNLVISGLFEGSRIGSSVHLRDLVRPDRLETGSELFQSFDGAGHRAARVGQDARLFLFRSRIVIDEQTTDIGVLSIALLRQILVRSCEQMKKTTRENGFLSPARQLAALNEEEKQFDEQ